MTRGPVRTLLLPLLLGIAVAGCDTLFGPEVPDSIEIVAGRSSVDVPGDTIMLQAVVRDEDGDRISDPDVRWESLQPAVVGVDGNGVVSALSNGTGSVVARSGSVADTLLITVATPIQCAPVGDLLVPDTVAGSMEPGDCEIEGSRGDFWRLTIESTMEVTIDMKASELDAVLVLLDDLGNFLTFDDDGGIGLNARLHLTLGEGTYYVFATSYYTASSGPYHLVAFEGGYPSPCPATATLALPDTVSGAVEASDCVFEGFRIDAWRMEIPAETTVVLRVSSDAITPVVVLTDTLGRILTGSNRGPGTDALLEVTLPAGSYDVWIGDAQSSQATGSYTLSAVLGRSLLTCDTVGRIEVGQVVEGEITPEDCYLYHGPAEGWDLQVTDSTTLQMTMHAEGLIPTILVSTDDGRVIDATEGDSARASFEVTLPPGEYRVWARVGYDLTGPYSLSISVAGQMPGCDASGAMAVGDTVDGALTTSDCLLEDGRYADIWTLAVDTTSLLTIGLESTKFDAFLVVADSMGQRIDRDDDGGGNGNASLTLELMPGSYQLWATSYEADTVGAYVMRVVPADSGSLGGGVLKPAPGGDMELEGPALIGPAWTAGVSVKPSSGGTTRSDRKPSAEWKPGADWEPVAEWKPSDDQQAGVQRKPRPAWKIGGSRHGSAPDHRPW